MTKDELIKAIVDREYERAFLPGPEYKDYWTKSYQGWTLPELTSYALLIGATK